MTTPMYCPQCEAPMILIVDDQQYPDSSRWICPVCGHTQRDEESAPDDYAEHWFGED